MKVDVQVLIVTKLYFLLFTEMERAVVAGDDGCLKEVGICMYILIWVLDSIIWISFPSTNLRD